jgi:SAM-dependent methyltransferase
MLNECVSEQRQEELRSAVRGKYRAVARQPAGHFTYPIGRESALHLGYRPEWLAAISSEIVERFVGVGNPFTIRQPATADRVLDVGCGCGLDTFVAALLVGPTGRSTGLDLTAEMLEWPRKAAAEFSLNNVGFQEDSAEKLPFEDASFDLITSNGVLNLVPDKDGAFAEICRVLRPGGVFAAADLLVVESIPETVLASEDAWSG